MPRRAHIALLVWGLLLAASVAPLSLAQAQERTVFAFLDLPYSAPLCGRGGSNVSLSEGDLGAALCNPALLGERTHNLVQLSYSYYGDGQNFASVQYGYNFGRSSLEKAVDEPDQPNYFAVGVHYLNYGKMPYADEYGHLTGGSFLAQDILIDVMYARQLGTHFTVGAALKPIYSAYEHYTSFALGADVGGHFTLPEKGLDVGLSLQNIGWQLKGFFSDEYGQKLYSLPLNLQLGLSYKLPHAPFRFSFTAHHLQTWYMDYQVSNIGSSDNSTSDIYYYADANAPWYDMLFRHTIWAVDIVPKSEKFYVSIAYNHRRRQELALKDTGLQVEQRGLAGFSLGAGLRLRGFNLGLAAAQYTRSNYVFQLTLGLNINQLK